MYGPAVGFASLGSARMVMQPVVPIMQFLVPFEYATYNPSPRVTPRADRYATPRADRYATPRAYAIPSPGCLCGPLLALDAQSSSAA
eukprot:364233-Chlamydomonas_euryale.AAC.11